MPDGDADAGRLAARGRTGVGARRAGKAAACAHAAGAGSAHILCRLCGERLRSLAAERDGNLQLYEHAAPV